MEADLEIITLTGKAFGEHEKRLEADYSILRCHKTTFGISLVHQPVQDWQGIAHQVIFQ